MRILRRNTEFRILNTEWKATLFNFAHYIHSVFRIQYSVFIGLAEVNIGESFTFQEGATAAESFTDFGSLITQWLPNVYVAAGIILFFLVLLGGFGVITNAGNQEKIQQGQKVLTSALIGFAILFGSYWIIQIIQVVTGVPILNPGL